MLGAVADAQYEMVPSRTAAIGAPGCAPDAVAVPMNAR